MRKKNNVLTKSVSTVADAIDRVTAMTLPATGSPWILVSLGSSSRDATTFGIKFRIVGAISLRRRWRDKTLDDERCPTSAGSLEDPRDYTGSV
jgi:hypothetical protein